MKWREIRVGDAVLAPVRSGNEEKTVYVVLKLQPALVRHGRGISAPWDVDPLRVNVTFLSPTKLFVSDFALDADIPWDVWCKVRPKSRRMEATCTSRT